ncbi:gamma carbonic anhydrase family protein [Candidatus Marinamargulisbacteria bacterium SCGC AG-410-N11]|nr:gamma carbonic anhydrase family protein [Candidatus Marinamargulisbacteria bacterium SCGC AG-410-N11]
MEKTDLRENIQIKTPIIDESVFVASNTSIIGDVRIGQQSSIWYGAVLRGDINYISIGKRSNIQDGTIIHLENDLPCIVGDDVTVGHRAILHGCKIEDGALIGMGAIVLNGAIVKKGAVIGAGAVVKEGCHVEPNELYVGVPAKLVRTLPETSFEKNKKWAEKYVKLARIHQGR